MFTHTDILKYKYTLTYKNNHTYAQIPSHTYANKQHILTQTNLEINKTITYTNTNSQTHKTQTKNTQA